MLSAGWTSCHIRLKVQTETDRVGAAGVCRGGPPHHVERQHPQPHDGGRERGIGVAEVKGNTRRGMQEKHPIG
jgi:hypothetical protein